jgi:curved DNA-binding protein CbpA
VPYWSMLREVIASEMVDWYEVLQVSPRAESDVIDAAFRCLARKYHPDVNTAPDATERMRTLNEAYEVLHYTHRRAAYDQARRTNVRARSLMFLAAQHDTVSDVLMVIHERVKLPKLARERSWLIGTGIAIVALALILMFLPDGDGLESEGMSWESRPAANTIQLYPAANDVIVPLLTREPVVLPADAGLVPVSRLSSTTKPSPGS